MRELQIGRGLGKIYIRSAAPSNDAATAIGLVTYYISKFIELTYLISKLRVHIRCARPTKTTTLKTNNLTTN